MKYAVVESGSVVRVVEAVTPYSITEATLVFGPIDSDGTYENAVFTAVPYALPNIPRMQAASDLVALNAIRGKQFNEKVAKALNIKI